MTNVYYIKVIIGEEFESILVGWFWLRFSQEVANQDNRRSYSTWRLDWHWRILFQATHVAVGKSPPFLIMWVFLQCCSWHDSWLPLEWTVQGKMQSKNLGACHDLALEVTHHHFWYILFYRPVLIQCRGGLTLNASKKDWRMGRWINILINMRQSIYCKILTI